MVIRLTHLHRNLWLESHILDNLLEEDTGNPKPLSTILEELGLFSKKSSFARDDDGKMAEDIERYKEIFGAMGEVLSEFWLRLFGGRYDLSGITDTSANKFQRGYDFLGTSVFGPFSVLIQIKMQGKPTPFEAKKLFTFIDEAKKAGSLPQYTILMVPTSDLAPSEILSYKNNFRAEYKEKIHYIGLNEVRRAIWSLPSDRGLNGNLEFFTRFRESLISSIACPVDQSPT